MLLRQKEQKDVSICFYKLQLEITIEGHFLVDVIIELKILNYTVFCCLDYNIVFSSNVLML